MPDIETSVITEPYLELDCALGEGPFYEEATRVLRFVDIIKKEVHTVNLQQGVESHKVVQLEDSVGITADIKGQTGEYLVAAKLGYAVFDKESEKLRYIKKMYQDNPGKAKRMRSNDGAVDSKGRFWAGTMKDFHAGEPNGEGCVFRLDPDMTLHTMIENVSIPNGLRWSPDDKTMYWTDSPTRSIFAFDYEPVTGTISNRRTFFRLADDGNSVVDGFTIDADGHLWAAIHEGGCVLRISPEGKVVAQVKVPAWRVTCPCFGGPDLDWLYITSAGINDPSEAPEGTKYHGSLFRIKTDVRGARTNLFGPFG